MVLQCLPCVATQCKTVGKHPDTESLWKHPDTDSLWNAIDITTHARIAYLRREAARFMRVGKGSSSIWACIDCQLADLCWEGVKYTSAFYNLVYKYDRQTFDRQNYFDELKVTNTFHLPSVKEIRAAMAAGAETIEESTKQDFRMSG
ncbi:uncharacterized protein MELLADRAFT_63417 [Melampsora larici-populina 98AG31]|uniref:Uncharacterized protein n=1 Tax=Melampsora larici-populina (strain 98AG31 / pathotype 3-4-7) TaxID=747676 RepID=F4RMK0_MELLP|nr:uncharacterized protein MELLADRAFT_63417 [Melampsora larici-populina 98AG31]EGG06456.1 hypothetical protein MELLADRAFT_63417 [Melampsora larici-populina 98AG31]